MDKQTLIAMAPGKELDELVAEKVMGWTRKGEYWLVGNFIRTIDLTSYGSFQPSTDIAAAWEVVNILLDNAGIDFEIKMGIVRKYEARLYDDGVCKGCFKSDTAPEAICKAALLVIG